MPGLNQQTKTSILAQGVRGAQPEAPPTTPVVTIVIVNWNSGTMLRGCLRSVLRPADNLQVKVIVVDNKSADDSPAMVEREFPEVSLIQSGANLGFGRGNNQARGHAQPGYVLFLNPDTEVRDHAIERMAGFLKANPDTGAVGCKMVFPDGEVADQNLQWFPNPFTEFVVHAFLTFGMVRVLQSLLPWNDPLRSGFVQKLYGGCCMVRTSVLEKVGWFDERFFMYAEDVDLSRRIREAGLKLYYLSDAEIMHVAGGATKRAGTDFSILMGCESMEKLITKYQGALAGLLYRGGILGASILRLCFLFIVMAVSPILRSVRGNSCRKAARNCVLRIKWAVGLGSVAIPE
jgi:GT2 family glycosyltransferase